MTILSTIAEGLARDVALGGGLKSPLLSWLGVVGLLLFFGWQIIRLRIDVSRASAPLLALEPLLTPLADEAEESDLRRSYERSFSEDRDGAPVGERPDITRLTELDTAMRETRALRRPWIQFRKSLLIERVPWFKEPRIFSTRRADEFFTPDAVLSPNIDLAFYGQLPSLITGFGLLLTFVAICVGLSRLHAEGTAIIGVQGLINGLAGKFLTSIVALVCANAFILVERPALRRLHRRYDDFLMRLDESFPRRTAEDLLDALSARRGFRTLAGAAAERNEVDEVPKRLAASIEELTSAVRALAGRAQEPEAKALERGAGDGNVVALTHRERRHG